ncbi:hypothetical protein [Rubellimicrobium aerolatum]|uniref:XRE family transcriptional regulator n=1 Tax=Rubellimicrobium aerolatum TaxID=490979 RepID=A0ABW0SEG2_9RHOB|nr:hypothetical protein [Rubellimicrobium aerolatum]MBP1806999.1 hypothetical protein [Rubellimicrobium aerolatum]
MTNVPPEAPGFGEVSPLEDARPIATILRAFIDRHRTTDAGAAAVLGRSPRTITRYLAGEPCEDEAGLRALLALIDEGRLPPPRPRGRKGRPRRPA